MPVVLSYLEPRVPQMEIESAPDAGCRHCSPPEAFAGPVRCAHVLASAQTESAIP
jgi:hypothetical protein